MLFNSKSTLSVKEVLQKLEYYCAYQERCHAEVLQKLHQFDISSFDKNLIIVQLIETNYLNEERFCTVFSQSKLHQKQWGKIRIKNELKTRTVSEFLINQTLKNIDLDEYHLIFETVSEKIWNSILEKNVLKKRKKFCDTLLRKGWESNLIYEKVKDLESSKNLD